MSNYLIPRNVETRFQFFPGFGWIEVGAVGVGVVLGFLLSSLLGLITGSVFRYLLILVFPAAAYFTFKPQPDGTTLYSVVRWWRNWKAGQKRYLYRGD